MLEPIPRIPLVEMPPVLTRPAPLVDVAKRARRAPG